MAPKKLQFTSDGIRIPSFEDSLKVGLAVGCALRNGEHQPLVILGKNTAHENYVIEHLIVAGLVHAGMQVTQTGPLPVPGVAMLTPSMRADLGIFIAGGRTDGALIRFFDGRSQKPDVEFRERVNLLLAGDPLAELAELPKLLGKNERIDDSQGRYVELAKAGVPRGKAFDDIRVVLDCANGAAYKVAPAAFHELGAEVRTFGVAPTGTNLEKECGFHQLKPLKLAVLEARADIGIAFNGDGDAVKVMDRNGTIATSEQLRALLKQHSNLPPANDCLIQALQLLHVFTVEGALLFQS